MRNALIPFVLIATTGCGLLGSGDSTLESYYTDCVEHYETMTDEVGDADDLEEFYHANEAWGQDWAVKRATAEAQLEVEIAQLDPEEREDRFLEVADLLKDLEEDCAEAVDDFQEEIQDDDDLLEDWGDLMEDIAEGWEDCHKAAKDEEYSGFGCSEWSAPEDDDDDDDDDD